MLHAFGQLLHITPQNNPTMLPYFAVRVRRGRCSISVAFTKIDFNVHTVSLVNSTTIIEKFGSFAAESQGFYSFL